MAQFRQPGSDRFPSRNNHDFDQLAGSAAARIHLHHHHHKPAAVRLRRHKRRCGLPAAAALTLLLLLLLVAALSAYLFLLSPSREIQNRSVRVGPKTLRFGHVVGVGGGRDSRYWDGDDRRREQDYGEVDDVVDSYQRSSGDGTKIQKESHNGGGGLYNEGGRKELDAYKREYEASEKNGGGIDSGNDDYDDGIDSEDEEEEEEKVKIDGRENAEILGKNEKLVSSVVPRRIGTGGGRRRKDIGSQVAKLGSKRKPKRSACEMKFLNSTSLLVEPVISKKFARFSLRYTDKEDSASGLDDWQPRFAGHQSLQEREESFYARDQKINCGFVKGPEGSASTGFDIAEDDVKFMSSCHIAVASCIFGNSDNLRIPYTKKITRQSRKNVCFVMFVDENTLQTLLSEGHKMDNAGFIGFWKILVVKNLPYPDMRRVGKVPKFLAHRLFPSARYSIWLDSKLRLQSDPLLILEYFLWRRGYEYAISNHYDRHCVWEEVQQNKKLNKFNHTIIDQQFNSYQADGLKRFDPLDHNKLLPSYVPEGSFIVRAHTPMSNLFSCLWFNEVDRWTPRDQLSFAYTYLKLRRMNPDKPFYLNMFKDCERRAIAKLFRHRGEEKRSSPTQLMR